MSRWVASYRRTFDRVGRRVSIERTAANAPVQRLDNVRVRMRGISREEIAGGISSNARGIMVLAEDVPEAWRPLRQNDIVHVDGLRLRFTQRPDDQAHRDGDLLLAYVGYVGGN